MRKFITIAAALLVSASASASDLYPAAKAVPYAVGYNWTGLYAGVHGGYGWGQTQDIANAGAAERKTNGGFGGLQAGYNYQINSIVIGAEADGSFGSISNSWGGTNQFDPYYGKDTVSTFGTLRGRVGYAFDRVLIYGTGGLAWGVEDHGFGCDAARVAVTNGCQNKKGGQKFYVGASPVNVGWTVGGGVEYAAFGNWTVKAEYLLMDLGTNSVTMADPNYPAAKSLRNFDTQFHTVRVGVNYRF